MDIYDSIPHLTPKLRNKTLSKNKWCTTHDIKLDFNCRI